MLYGSGCRLRPCVSVDNDDVDGDGDGDGDGDDDDDYVYDDYECCETRHRRRYTLFETALRERSDE